MFPCSSCGLCCRNIDKVKELREFDLGNGTCKYLDIVSNSCVIYDTRPDICNIAIMYNKQYKQHFQKKEFYILNANICNHLQKEYSLHEKFKIQIGE